MISILSSPFPSLIDAADAAALAAAAVALTRALVVTVLLLPSLPFIVC